MKSAWDIALERAEKYESKGGKYLRLPGDRDKAVVKFCGTPESRDVVWIGDKYENLDRNRHDATKASFRVAVNVYVPADHAMKIFEGSIVWFRDLLKVHQKYGFEKKLFEIERHGKAKDTKTKYSILPDEDISPELIKELKSAQLYDLTKIDDGGNDDDEAEPVDGLINEDEAREIATRMKGRPRPVIDAFLSEFKITKVRELRASQMSAVETWIDDVASTPSMDPFA